MALPALLLELPVSPMDHLPAPFAPVHLPVEVPYLGTEEYDGGPFLTYPSREGWLSAEIDYPKAPVSSRSQIQIDSFLQNWLWFGLLKDFLGHVVNVEDFVVERSNGQRLLTTRNLKGQLNKWILRERAFSLKVKQRRRALFNSLLWRAFNVLRAWSQALCDPFTNSWTAISLSILGQTLDHAWQEAFFGIPSNTMNHAESIERYQNWPIDPHNMINKRLTEDGWCPSTIRRLSGPLTQGGRYFASRTSRPNPEIKHGGCSLNVCVAQNIPLDLYRQRHCEDKCTCDTICVDRDQVITILKNGGVPIVSFTDQGKLTVVDAPQSKSKYVAISHVWSDGLGNPQDNGLPRCQLGRLAGLAAKLYGNPSEPIYIWLDTLCCPTSPKWAKNLAIASMRKTYQLADKVLVLDSSLQNQPFLQISQIEVVMRIHNSQWNRRLWTLDECVLAESRLWFQLDGGVLNPKAMVDHLLADYLARNATASTQSPLEGPAADAFAIGLRTPVPTDLYSLSDLTVNIRDRVLTVQHALQDRQTSDTADEAICLAHLLNMDVMAILETPKDKRMEAFWSMIDDIPSDIVFWMRGTLNAKSLRWAPSTFLGGLGLLGGSGKADASSVVLSGSGLLAQYPGWTLGSPPGEYVQIKFYFVDGSQNAYAATCYPKGFDGTAATIGQKFINPWSMLDCPATPETELALITRSDLRRSATNDEFSAALVIVTAVHGNLRYCRKICSASVQKMDIAWIGPKATKTLESMRRAFAGRPMPPKWCGSDQEGGIVYSDFMSGVATDRSVSWCVD